MAKGTQARTARSGECRRILIRMMVTKANLLIFALYLRCLDVLFLFSLAHDMGSEVEGKDGGGMARQIKGSRRRDEATTKK